jgi:peptidoglycan/LPS O-acetylase OafA/YrhL
MHRKVFFPNLDGLRFFAFFTVFIDHAYPEPPLLPPRLVAFIFGSGWAGVSFFFVLSGFLITYLILTEIKVTGRVDVQAFYVRRILRIWPLYYLVLLFAFAIFPFIQGSLRMGPLMVGPLKYIFFLSNFVMLSEVRVPLFLSITWSVAIEEQFYLVWPLLFFYTPPRFYRLLFPAIILLSFLFRLYWFWNIQVLYYHTLSVISDMAIGGMAAYYALNSKRFIKMLEGMPRRLIAAVYAVGLCLILLHGSIFVGYWRAFERLVIPLFFVFIVLEQNYSNSLFKMSRLKLISKLGIYTYGLYLLHPIAITLLNRFKVTDSPSAHAYILGTAAFGLTILLSVTSYYLFEKRFLNLKRHFTHVPSAQTEEPAVTEDLFTQNRHCSN